MSVVTIHSDEALELIDPAAELTEVASGFVFVEGPIWHPVDQQLVFSDVLGDARWTYSPDAGAERIAHPTNMANGMTLDRDLNLIICEHATSVVARRRTDGTREILASHYDGRELNSPNDVCVRRDGSIYFTDPSFGRTRDFGVEREQELDFQGVYRISPDDRSLALAVDRSAYEQPNGLCFSVDESMLYINDSARALIDVYDVDQDGTLRNRRCFKDGIGNGVVAEGVPDGMKCDERGNIWVTGPGGLWIIDPAGRHIATIHVPQQTANHAWGGPDRRNLYIQASTSVYMIPTHVGPHRESFMTSH
tara:strand:+ start:24 stop:944 length:921 start_codon:yes stop_codon:yes gene_type:complete